MDDSRSVAAITRYTSVAEADRMSVIGPIQVGLDYSLEQIVEAIERAPWVQAVCVIDGAGRLQGVIPFRQIVDEVFMRVVPAEFLSEMHSIGDAQAYAERSRLLHATTAAAMMAPLVFVHRDETVAAAFHKMRSANLLGVPIVDDTMVVVGYIDLLELMMVWLRAERRAGGAT